MNRELVSGASDNKVQNKSLTLSITSIPAQGPVQSSISSKVNKSQLYDKSTGVINLQSIGKVSQNVTSVTATIAPTTTAPTPATTVTIPTPIVTSTDRASKNATAIKRAMRLFDRSLQKLRILFQTLTSSETSTHTLKVILDLGLVSSSLSSPYSSKGANSLYFHVTSASTASGNEGNDTTKTKSRSTEKSTVTKPVTGSSVVAATVPSTIHTNMAYSVSIAQLLSYNTSTKVILEGGHYESLVRAFNPHYLAHGRHQHFNAAGIRMNLDSVTSLLVKQVTKATLSISAAATGNRSKIDPQQQRIQNELQQTASSLYKRMTEVIARPQVLVLEKASGMLASEVSNNKLNGMSRTFGYSLNSCVDLLRKRCSVVITDSLSQTHGFSAHTTLSESKAKGSAVSGKMGQITASVPMVRSTTISSHSLKPASSHTASSYYSSPAMLPTLFTKEDAVHLCHIFGVSLLVLVSNDLTVGVQDPATSASCACLWIDTKVSHNDTELTTSTIQELPSIVNKYFTPIPDSPALSMSNLPNRSPNTAVIKRKGGIVNANITNTTTHTSEILCIIIDSKSSSQSNTKGTSLNSRDKRLLSASQGVFKEKSLVSIKEKIVSYFIKSNSNSSAVRASESFTLRVGQIGKSSILHPSLSSTASSSSQNKRLGVSLSYVDPIVFACDIPFPILRELGTAILSIGLSSSINSVGTHVTPASNTGVSVNSTSVTASSGGSSLLSSSVSLSRFLIGLEAQRETHPALKKDIRLLLSELLLSPALAATYTLTGQSTTNDVVSSSTGSAIVARVYLYSIPDDRVDILVYDPVVLSKILMTDKLLQI